MIHLNTYVTEKLKISKDTFIQGYHPKTWNELYNLVKELIKERGVNADLNDIDVSNMTDMHSVFAYSSFNGDISNWDVSNVKRMNNMFGHSNFNGDISKWDVSNVEYMGYMFQHSKFNNDISEWIINRKCKMPKIFFKCPLEKNPPAWYEEYK